MFERFSRLGISTFDLEFSTDLICFFYDFGVLLSFFSNMEACRVKSKLLSDLTVWRTLCLLENFRLGVEMPVMGPSFGSIWARSLL